MLPAETVRAAGERHVREPGSAGCAPAQQQEFHEPLARPHEARRCRCLVGGLREHPSIGVAFEDRVDGCQRAGHVDQDRLHGRPLDRLPKFGPLRARSFRQDGLAAPGDGLGPTIFLHRSPHVGGEGSPWSRLIRQQEEAFVGPYDGAEAGHWANMAAV